MIEISLSVINFSLFAVGDLLFIWYYFKYQNLLERIKKLEKKK